MNKIVRFAISAGTTLTIFVIAARLHGMEMTTGSILNNATQLQFIPTNPGILMYAIAMVLMLVSTWFGRRSKLDIVSGLSSYAIWIVRIIAMLAMVSGGVSIFVFSSKIGQIIQLLCVVATICVQFAMRPKSVTK
jgi:hypothetical protein